MRVICILILSFLIASCTYSNSVQSDTVNLSSDDYVKQESDTLSNNLSYTPYDLDSILNIINTKVESMPQELKSCYYKSKIVDDYIQVGLTDSCDRTINMFKKHVVDSPVVKFKQIIAEVDLLWLEVDTDEIESPTIEKSLDEDIVDSSDSIVSDTLHRVNDEHETMDSVTAKSNL